MPGPYQDAPISGTCQLGEHEECDGKVAETIPCGCGCHDAQFAGSGKSEASVLYLQRHILAKLEAAALEPHPQLPPASYWSPLRAKEPDGFNLERLNKEAFPFVPTSEDDAPGPDWFEGNWEWEAFAIQARHGTLLPETREVQMELGTIWVNGQQYDYLFEPTDDSTKLALIEAAVRAGIEEMQANARTVKDGYRQEQTPGSAPGKARPRHLHIVSESSGDDSGGTEPPAS